MGHPLIMNVVISFSGGVHVILQSMVKTIFLDNIHTREKISANIFDITARKFFRREDLSILIDHIINY